MLRYGWSSFKREKHRVRADPVTTTESSLVNKVGEALHFRLMLRGFLLLCQYSQIE